MRNTGSIEATGLTNNGGVVRLEASDSISHTGSINVDAAPHSTGHGGTATLIASLDNPNSTTQINGSINARGGDVGGNGGFVETSASNLKIDDNTRVTTQAKNGESGTWLLDPTNFTISTGTAAQTTSEIGADTLQTALGSGNVSIATSAGGSEAGDINVNAAVSWSANKLTLSAHNDININADMTVTSTGSLALEFGLGAVASNNTSTIKTTGAKVYLPASTTNFTTKQGSDGLLKSYTVITSLGAAGSSTSTDLQGMQGNLTKNYALGADIDASATNTWNSGLGFSPVGNSESNRFGGIFDGLGHTISGLYINRPTQDYVGLFGVNFSSAPGVYFRNIGLINSNITGRSVTGGLVAYAWGTTNISNSYSTNASITGASSTGGLVGYSTGSLRVSNSYTSGTVSGTSQVGGLIGYVGSNSVILNSHSTASVTATGSSVGGLIGFSSGGSITVDNSYATGNVTASATSGSVGGLIGAAEFSGLGTRVVSNSYATGDVFGHTNVGGLIGWNRAYTVSDSYATGDVSGTSWVGGLIGSHGYGGTVITRTYATGNVTGTYEAIGGLVGAGGYITYSYATGNVSGDRAIGGLVGNAEYISNSYARGDVTGTSLYIGGLVGILNSGNTVLNSYSTGAVANAVGSVGGLVGFRDGTVTNSFWDIETSGQATSNGGRGMTTAQMKDILNFTSATADNGNVNPGWDFSTTPIWKISPSNNDGYPCLVGVGACPATTSIFLRLIPGSSIYGDAPIFTYDFYDAAIAGTVISDASPTGTVVWSGTPSVPTGASNVGDYSLTYNGGITLGNSDYSLFAGNAATWSIAQRPIIVTTNDSSKILGSPDPALTYSMLGNLIAPDTMAVTTSRELGESVGSYLVSALASASSNYIITINNSGRLSILPLADLTPLPPPPPPPPATVQQASNTPPSLGYLNSGVSVSVESMPSLSDNGIVLVTVPKDTATSGEGFSFTLSKQLEELINNNGGDVSLKTPSGENLPSWLSFDPETLTITSSAVPDGAFPLKLTLTTGSDTFTVIISERTEDSI